MYIDNVVEKVYPELRRIAAGFMSRERPNHTLQATAVVHEAVLRILGLQNVEIQNPEHFFYLAVGQMRHILTSHARQKLALKRTSLPAPDEPPGTPDLEQILIVDQVLDRLGAVDRRAQTIVMLRFFGGLSMEEIAGILGISLMTAQRDWAWARLWLYSQIGGQSRRERLAG
jgi:RNA polymerase sigma factor (TIGR02999 family)